MKPLVSVIIPVYNVAPYLREALDSVVCQTYISLQIIIVDDGSTDESGAICDEYQSDRRVTVIHQENRGLSNARNIGLDTMTGDYVAFLDSDDAYHPEFVERMLDVMNREKPDIAVCRYVMCQNNGGTMRDTWEKSERNHRMVNPVLQEGTYDRIAALRAFVDDKLNVSVWNKLYRRSLWREIRFPDGHNYEDIESTYRILDIADSVYVVDCPLYFHRRQPGSITCIKSEKNINDRKLALSHLDAFIDAHIPDIFTREQLEQHRNKRLHRMIVGYLNNTADKAFGEQLRNDIIKDAKAINNWRFRIKTAYLMLYYCPWLLKITYPIYRFFRLLVRKATGK